MLHKSLSISKNNTRLFTSVFSSSYQYTHSRLHSTTAFTSFSSAKDTQVSRILSFSSPSSPSSVIHYNSSIHHNTPRQFHQPSNDSQKVYSTTILSVRKGNSVVIIGDGQVSQGYTILKGNAKKVRVIGKPTHPVVIGFAGSTADCLTLADLLEQKLEQFPGQLLRASVELSKNWRTDKYLRQLEATAICIDKDISVNVTGNGDVIGEPTDGVTGIGSGGLYAVSAARALVEFENLSAREIALRSMTIAANICTMTNDNFTVEEYIDGVLLTGEAKTAKELEDKAMLAQWEEKRRNNLRKPS